MAPHIIDTRLKRDVAISLTSSLAKGFAHGPLSLHIFFASQGFRSRSPLSSPLAD